VVVPITGGDPVTGELTLWSGGEVVATCRILVGEAAVADLVGGLAFARIRGDDAMIVVQARVGMVPGRPDEVELVGVTGVAVQARREAVRAELRRPVLLLPEVSPLGSGRSLDLSASGCRVEVPADTPLSPGDRLHTVITDSDGATLWLRSEVIRVDRRSGEAALRFLDVGDGDTERINREVLAWLAGYLHG
jgi:hypothetical protein